MTRENKVIRVMTADSDKYQELNVLQKIILLLASTKRN